MSEKSAVIGILKVWDAEKKEWFNQNIYLGALHKEYRGYVEIGKVIVTGVPCDEMWWKEMSSEGRDRFYKSGVPMPAKSEKIEGPAKASN